MADSNNSNSVLSIISLFVSIASLFYAYQADQHVTEANDLAKEANRLANDANNIATDAKKISSDANAYAEAQVNAGLRASKMAHLDDIYSKKSASVREEAVREFIGVCAKLHEDIILRNADLRDMDLHGIDFGAADLGGSLLSGANLNGANLSRTSLRKSQVVFCKKVDGSPIPLKGFPQIAFDGKYAPVFAFDDKTNMPDYTRVFGMGCDSRWPVFDFVIPSFSYLFKK